MKTHKPRDPDPDGAVDLTPDAGKILAGEDKPLFAEAVVAAQANALRAAHLMTWLACAESLKRRFREAGKRDSTAGKIAGDILSKEANTGLLTNSSSTRRTNTDSYRIQRTSS